MNKHTLISFVLFAFLSLNVNAQRWGVPNLKEYDYEPFHFGFLLGINQMGFSIKQDYNGLYDSKLPDRIPATYTGDKIGEGTDSKTNYYQTSVLPSSTTGFTVGIVGSFRLTNNFNFRIIPSISFGGRTLTYTYVETDKLTEPQSTIKSINSTFLELPLILRYSGERIQNARPFIQAGIKYMYDLSSDANKATTADQLNVVLKKSDIYGVLGVGFEFYFDWFKMGVEATTNYGFTDVLKHGTNMYNNSINRLNSKVFQISVTFE